MREFFHGWRRKVGVVTLVMALVMMALWIRSYVLFDQIFVLGNLVLSNSGCIVWDWQGWGGPDANFLHFYSDRASPFDVDWYFGTDGIRLPYWIVTIPLTLLTAYLILWKPREKPKNTVAEFSQAGK